MLRAVVIQQIVMRPVLQHGGRRKGPGERAGRRCARIALVAGIGQDRADIGNLREVETRGCVREMRMGVDMARRRLAQPVQRRMRIAQEVRIQDGQLAPVGQIVRAGTAFQALHHTLQKIQTEVVLQVFLLLAPGRALDSAVLLEYFDFQSSLRRFQHDCTPNLLE